MRRSSAEALLIDHPAVPVPASCDAHGFVLPELPRLAERAATGRQRAAFAVQLLAAAAHLADRDLWPGPGSLRGASVREDDGVARAVLGSLPVRLTPLLRRLGGGERALRRLRDAVLVRTAAATGLPSRRVNELSGLRSPFLEPCLERLLADLPVPLDRATARALWCVQWRLPRRPGEGEALYWRVPDPVMAQRLGAAMLAAARDDDVPAWWLAMSPGEQISGPLPAAGSRGLLVLSGRLTNDDLEAVARWIEHPGCSAVALGELPAGWDPPPPVLVEPSRLGLQLRLLGLPPERARREVERRAPAWDPVIAEDRAALTRAAAHRFREPLSEPEGGGAGSRLHRVLGLLPEGVPEGFVVLHAGAPPAALRRELETGAAVCRGGRWASSAPTRLRPDELHREVAALLPEDGPRRLRHLVLAGGDPAELVSWARRRVEDVDGATVRAILAPVAPEALGPALLELLLEACLTELDLAGMRSALPACQGAARRAWQRCVEAVDAGGADPSPPPDDEVEASPRAAAEVMLRGLQAARNRGPGLELEAPLDRCLGAIGGPLRAVLEVRRTLLQAPDRLRDRSWRRTCVGARPAVRREWLRCRALTLLRHGRPRAADRLFRRLTDTSSPGRLGLLHLDLGAAALLDGRSSDAEREHLRALRLLEAAGFRRRLEHVRFNLGVGDLDHLRIESAQQRLTVSGESPDPVLELELARLALATGDEPELRRRLETLDEREVADGFGTAAALGMLRGVVRLLDGDLDGAVALLEGGGEEGRAWLGLAAALTRGSEPHADADDGWGVWRCARHAARLQRGDRPEDSWTEPSGDVRDDFALALLERVCGRQAWLAGACRTSLARRLERRGLRGWAERVAAEGTVPDAAARALAELLDGSTLDRLHPDLLGALLRGLGVTGLEVIRGGREDVQVGEGSPGVPLRSRGLEITPLGGEAGSDGLWHLLMGALGHTGGDAARSDPDPEAAATGIHGGSAATVSLRRELRVLAGSSVPVMILGETGVGKEVAASAIHRLSGRSGEFMPVNVAAIPSALLEADLFGVVRGAFTGADRSRRGLVDAADGGTLFLDEIGDLDLALQVKLLRFLESMEVRPVGATKVHRVDVRVVSATHRDLRALVREGAFRQDLFYRIGSAEVKIRPLRERLEDIPVLRRLFADQAVASDGLAPAHWSPAADALLCRHDWPGNVRELKHVVQVALVRAAGGTVLPEHLPISAPQVELPLPRGGYEQALVDFRRRLLAEALARNSGNRSAAARELGISRQTLLYHMKALKLK